jgi:hypothetical protein
MAIIAMKRRKVEESIRTAAGKLRLLSMRLDIGAIRLTMSCFHELYRSGGCAPQVIRTAGIFLGDVTENSEFALHNPCMACCVAMQTLRQLFHAVSVLFCLAQDALRFLLIGARSSAALKAENLFLRKQLALFVERKAKPRRASDAIRLTLVLLSRLFSWREALVNVKPETFLRWHRKGFQLLWRWSRDRREKSTTRNRFMNAITI